MCRLASGDFAAQGGICSWRGLCGRRIGLPVIAPAGLGPVAAASLGLLAGDGPQDVEFGGTSGGADGGEDAAEGGEDDDANQGPVGNAHHAGAEQVEGMDDRPAEENANEEPEDS